MARILFISLAGAALCAGPAAAQRTDAPLGDIVEAIDRAEEAKPPVRPAAPPPPRPRRPAPPPSGVATTDLPPSDAAADRLDYAPLLDDEAAAGPAEPNPWEAERERRRAEINAEEGPQVERLNRAIADRHEANRRAAERAEAEHRRRLAEIEAETRRREAEHRAALDAHAREVERRRAAHEARVRACLDGIREACAQPHELPPRR